MPSVRILPLLLALAPTLAAAQEISLSHSGRLYDGDDKPVDLPTAQFTFRIYDKALPEAQTLAWEGSCSTEVKKGYYSVSLGGGGCGSDVLTADMLPIGQPRFLEVQIGDAKLTPRLRIGTSPTAGFAANAGKLGNKAPADYALKSDFGGVALPATGTPSGTTFLRGDGKWETPAAAGSASGDLDGTFPSPKVAKLQGSQVSADAPVAGDVLTFASGAWAPKALPAIPALAGDVTGAIGSSSVTRLRGTPVSESAPAEGQILAFTGGAWSPGPLTVKSSGGLTGNGATGSELSIAADGVGPTQLASNAGSLARVSAGALTLVSGRLGIGTADPKSTLHVAGAIQPGNDTGACDAGKTGAVRFTAGRLEACNGTVWSSLAALARGTTGRTKATAAATCKAIRDAEPASEDGWYWITAGATSTTGYQAYCDMTRDGGGWARVVENASYTGVASNNVYQALVGGTFGEIRGTWRSGYVACNSASAYPQQTGSSPWQACRGSSHGDVWSFEVLRDGAVFLGAASNAWNLLPPECVAPVSVTSPMLCTKSITLTRESTTLTPTWYENRTNTSTGDNAGTIFVDLWVR